jgi:hypothetical protein
LVLETHSATPIPHYVDLPPDVQSVREAHKIEPYASALDMAKIPSITLRDLRLAILIQGMYYELPLQTLPDGKYSLLPPEKRFDVYSPFFRWGASKKSGPAESQESPENEQFDPFEPTNSEEDSGEVKEPHHFSEEEGDALENVLKASRTLAQYLLKDIGIWEPETRRNVIEQIPAKDRTFSIERRKYGSKPRSRRRASKPSEDPDAAFKEASLKDGGVPKH